MERFTRNFIIPDDIKIYYDSLLNKIKMSNNDYDVKGLELLFSKLFEYEEKDKIEYERIIKYLSQYEENFVLNNGFVLYKLLCLTDDERKILMIHLNNINYKSDLDIFNVMVNLIKSFNDIITNYVDNLISDIEYSQQEYYSKAQSIKKGENKEIIGCVLQEFYDKHPEILKYELFNSAFANLMFKLISQINDIAYNYIIGLIENKEFNKNETLKGYLSERVQTRRLAQTKYQIKNRKKLH